MRLIDAFWEKRNLGLSVAEITFEAGETPQQLDPNLFKTYDYVVAKVPSGEVSTIHGLEQMGFRFLESQFDLSIRLNNIPQRTQSSDFLMKKITTSPLDSRQQIEELVEHITPELFEVDRVSIDPEVGKTVGALRYKNWVLDEYNKGNIFAHRLNLGSIPIGFFILKKIGPSKLFAMLAGLFIQYKNKGLGLSIVQKPIDWAREQKYEEIVTRNSSNNSESFKIHLACGYRLDSISYLLRWKRKDNSLEGANHVKSESHSKSFL